MNDIITYPEIKQYLLINLFSNSEEYYTEKHLLEVFGYDEFIKILNNRSNAWQLIEV